MAKQSPGEDDFTEDLMPEIAPPPVISRKFKPLGWYRPRKQYVRKYQWNYEIVQQVLAKRGEADAPVLRVFGLPSDEYLDLMSMREFCQRKKQLVHYLGFNSSHPSLKKTGRAKKEPVDLYADLQAQRLIEASSFIHPSSVLYPDRFELLRHATSQCRVVLDRFANFDIINLDICGCIVDPNEHKATDVLEAIAELLRWQSVRRLTPWLLFLTTYCQAENVNRKACQTLIDAVKQNASVSSEFKSDFERKAKLSVQDFHSSFSDPEGELPPQNTFMSLFSAAIGKWLACRLRLPKPSAFVTMLPSYCFRHVDDDDPRTHDPEQAPCLLSLAYLIEPAPEAGEGGIAPIPKEGASLTGSTRYVKHARQILNKSFANKDLDELLASNHGKRKEVVDETRELLVGCGFAAADVNSFLSRFD
jgi:hypothetical protein